MGKHVESHLVQETTHDVVPQDDEPKGNNLMNSWVKHWKGYYSL